MTFSLTMPALGESVTEGTVTRWLKNEGDQVAIDEPLLEVSTDKVDTEVPSPVSGILTEVRAKEGDTVPVGAVIAVVGDAGAAFDVVGGDLVHEFGHTRGAAGALQATRATVQAGCVHSHAAGVITPVFEPLQALHKNGNDVAGRNGADDATHEKTP